MTRGRVSRDEVLRRLNPHLTRELRLPGEQEWRFVDPREFLRAERFDLPIKVRYAADRAFGLPARWSRWAYLEHLRAFNELNEGDGSGKRSAEDFLDAFHRVIDDVRRAGFRPETSLVPISPAGVVIDGAHRVAACLALDTPVAVIEIERDARYDAGFFLERGLPRTIADEAALELVRRSPRARLFFVWSAGLPAVDAARTALETRGAVLYEKHIRLAGEGPTHLMRHVYASEPWLGDDRAGWPGARAKADACFSARAAFTVFIVVADDRVLLEEKVRFREQVGVGNHACHVTDDAAETTELARLLLNDESVACLNHAPLVPFAGFRKMVRALREDVAALDLDVERICLGGSAMLGVLHLREPHDLDLLSIGYADVRFPHEFITDHSSQARYYPHPLEEIVADPRLHLWWDSVKVASPEVTRAMKRARGEKKDIDDVRRLGDRSARRRFLDRVRDLRGPGLRARLKRRVPAPLRPAAGLAWRAARRTWRAVRDRIRGGHELCYRGFELRCHPRTSLLGMLVDGVYEPSTTRAILRELDAAGAGAFVDVGANIGLITLNVLLEHPGRPIVCFEPGPAQARALRDTLAVNGLTRRVEALEVALGDAPGRARFATHSAEHLSGDGFRDTGRAGATRWTEVEVDTLDAWWSRAGRPGIAVVKIDVEGAELLVLSGGVDLIGAQRPTLILEVNPKNLAAYAHGVEELSSWLRGAGYVMETLEGTPVSWEALPEIAGAATDNFVARPQERA